MAVHYLHYLNLVVMSFHEVPRSYSLYP